MFIKVRKHQNGSPVSERLDDVPPTRCDYITVHYQPDGIEISVSPDGRMIRLPEDGDVCYVEDSQGDTIETYRWPMKSGDKDKEGNKSKPKELRVTN